MNMCFEAGIYRLYYEINGKTYDYIGSTNCLRQRFSEHCSRVKNDKCNDYLKPLYLFIRNNGGWENWFHEVLEVLPKTITETELFDIENKYINLLKPNLNYYTVPNRSLEERLQTKLERTQSNDCDCGGSFTQYGKKRHLRTDKHQNYLKFQYC
tara:strand:- start:305 stop:766 length:462 start_codon:yes stop_codon:yes gene_type:complete